MSLCKASSDNGPQLFIEPKGDLLLQTSSTTEVQAHQDLKSDNIAALPKLLSWKSTILVPSIISGIKAFTVNQTSRATGAHCASLTQGYHLCVIQFVDAKNTQKKKQIYVAGIAIPRRSSEELHICFVSPFVYPVNILFSDPRNMPDSIQWKEWHVPSVGKLKTNKQAVISNFWFRIRVFTWHPTGHISRCQIHATSVGNILQCFS